MQSPPIVTRPLGPLTEIELSAWVTQAMPGDCLEYHRGFLAVDLMPHATRLDAHAWAELGRVARCALRAAEHGLVHLVQHRQGPDDFSYRAIARPKPRNAPAMIDALLEEEAA